MPWTRAEALMDLYGLASFKDSSFRTDRGILVDVKRGQCAWSIKSLADRWSWSTTKVNCFLKELESVSHIVAQKDNVTTITTMLFYDPSKQEVSQNGSQESRISPAKVSQGNTLEGIKEVKQGNKPSAHIEQEGFIEALIIPKLALLKLVPDYPFDAQYDLDYLVRLATEFPQVDMSSLLKNWREYIGGIKQKNKRGFKKNANPRSQLRSQFEMAVKNKRHLKTPDNGSGPQEPDALDIIKKGMEAEKNV